MIRLVCLLRGTYAECAATSNIISADTGKERLCAAQEAREKRKDEEKKQCMVIILENAKAVASV